MDNTTNEPQPDATPPIIPDRQVTPKKSKSRLFIVLIIILAVAIGIGGYSLGMFLNLQTNSNDQASTTGTPDNWQMLASNKQGFPIPDNGVGGALTYYSVEKAAVITLEDIKLGNSGGSAGLGSGSPLASPNLNYISFIGEGGNLWLFSVESEQTQQLTTNGLVSYITDWSPDSKNILYYYDQKTIANSGGGIDAPVPTSSTFKPQIEQGFYQTNIETGEVTPLAPIEHTDGYINNSTLLAKESYESENLVSFDIPALRADRNAIDIKAGFGVGQFDFSSDGKMWAFLDTMVKENPTKGETRIALGDYPAVTTTIDSGDWASVQRPIFSPNNQKIAYQKPAGRIGGIPQNHVWVYDISSKTKVDAGMGAPILWVDDKTIFISEVRESGQESSYALLNVETNEKKQVSK